MASVLHVKLKPLLLVGDAVFHGPYFIAEIETLEDTCLWMSVHIIPVNYVSEKSTGSVVFLAWLGE